MSSFKKSDQPKVVKPAHGDSSSQDVLEPNTSKAPPSTADGPGTRNIAGATVVSTGLNDLDRLLGGGIPLGSLVIVTTVCAALPTCACAVPQPAHQLNAALLWCSATLCQSCQCTTHHVHVVTTMGTVDCSCLCCAVAEQSDSAQPRPCYI